MNRSDVERTTAYARLLQQMTTLARVQIQNLVRMPLLRIASLRPTQSLKAFFKEIEQHGKFADMNALLNQVYGVSTSAVRQLDRSTRGIDIMDYVGMLFKTRHYSLESQFWRLAK